MGPPEERILNPFEAMDEPGAEPGEDGLENLLDLLETLLERPGE